MSDEITSTKSKIYYENLPTWPAFDVYDKTVDGLVPSAQIDSWESFNLVVKKYLVDEGEEFIFRGHQNYKWFLESTLDRFSEGAIDEKIAERQLRNFSLSIRGRVRDNSIFRQNAEELWAIGQHHGLATPLLDWTAAPYVALFFAYMDEDPESWADKDGNSTNVSRAIYVLNKTFLEDLTDSEINGYPKIVEPSNDDHGRLVNQAGLFTISPYGETLESSLLKALVDSGVNIDDPNELAKYICKIHIPNSRETRSQCLRQLRKMNIHFASIFPDIIGASGFCNELIKEHIRYSLNSKNLPPESTVENGIQQTDETAIDTPPGQLHVDLGVSRYEITQELQKNPQVNDTFSDKTLKYVIRNAIDFIDNQAGIDWYKRDSQLARMRTMLRRSVNKFGHSDEEANLLIEPLMQLASDLSKAAEEANGNDH